MINKELDRIVLIIWSGSGMGGFGRVDVRGGGGGVMQKSERVSPDFRFLEVGISAKVSLHVIKSAVKCDRTFYLLLAPYQSNSHDICMISKRENSKTIKDVRF